MGKKIYVKRFIEMLHTQLTLPMKKTRRKLRKLGLIVNSVKEKCQKPDQSYQNVAVNQRLEK